MAEFDDEYDDEQDDEQDLTDEEEATANAAEDQYIEEDKENSRQEILAQFHALKRKYMMKSTFWPFLSLSELKLCNKVKKIAYGEYAAFMNIVAQRKGAFTAKMNSILATIAPILPYILIALVVVIAILAIMGAVMPWIAGDGDISDGMSSVMGAKGDCFYGVRAIYRDADKAVDDLQDDYVDMLSYTIKNFESGDVTLNITLPAENYNFADFGTNETYKDAYNLVVDLAKIVYSVDNSVSVESAPNNLDDLLAQIKYFGVDDEFVDDIAVAWAEYIVENSLYTASEDVQVDQTNFSTQFESLLLNEYASAETNRTEMFYVKDYLFADDETTAENIPQKDYVAYIFMPKKAVDVSYVCFSVSGQTEDFKMFLNANGSITEFESEVLYEKEYEDETTSYLYNLEIEFSAQPFANFDVNNAANDVSLYSLLHSVNAENYLSKTDGDFYTYKNGAFEVTFENGTPFYMAEYELDYVAARL